MRTNLIDNGGFDGNLDEWAGTGAINRALGYPRLGCAEIEAGESVTQAEGLSNDQLYTLHYFYRLASGATLTVSYGSVSQTYTAGVTGQWREGIMAFALDAPGNDSVSFAASGGTVQIDTVTMLIGGLPILRANIAAQVAARIAELATDASLSRVASADGPEGDYSAAIDEALRSVGAVNRWGDPDVCQLMIPQVNQVIEGTQNAMLQRLRSRYSLETDVALGPRRESRSQIAASIDAMLSGSGADRRINIAPLRRAGGWER